MTDDLDYSRHYLRYHSDTPTHYERVAKIIREKLAPHVSGNQHMPVLEIGCGMGFGLLALKQMGFNDITGVDTSPAQVSAARKAGLPALLMSVDEIADFLQRNSERFGIVIMLDVLEHVPVAQTMQLLRNIFASLSADGLFICQVPNAASVVGGRMRYVDWTHHQSFTWDSLDFVLFNAGFKTVRVLEAEPLSVRAHTRTLGGPIKLLMRVVTRLAWRFALASELPVGHAMKMPISPNILAVARKA